jgi:hypothetical protein
MKIMMTTKNCKETVWYVYHYLKDQSIHPEYGNTLILDDADRFDKLGLESDNWTPVPLQVTGTLDDIKNWATEKLPYLAVSEEEIAVILETDTDEPIVLNISAIMKYAPLTN